MDPKFICALRNHQHACEEVVEFIAAGEGKVYEPWRVERLLVLKARCDRTFNSLDEWIDIGGAR